MGAAHIGETRFAAGLFYSYICINRELLVKNLDGNEELANKAIRALTERRLKSLPKASKTVLRLALMLRMYWLKRATSNPLVVSCLPQTD